MNLAMETMRILLKRLDELLPVHEPEVWASLRDPVSERDLADLSAAITPHQLPNDVVELLRWHDRQAGAWWPLMACGPLLGATEAAEQYKYNFMREIPEDWHRSWLPIAAEGWYRVGVEMAGEHKGLLIEASSPERPSPLAPSIAAMLHATCDVLEAGIRAQSVDVEGDEQLWQERNDITARRYTAYGGLPPDDVLDPAS
jgi:cell wall assembly regulator SMI1